MFSVHAAVEALMYRLTAVMVWVFVSPVSAVVDLVTHLPLTDTAPVPTLELIGSARRTLCGQIP